MWEIAKSVRDDGELRRSFNELAKKTFDLDFEDWHQNGFWGNNYIPYSVVMDGKVVANVSVNRTDMLWNGSKKHLIQLGTVMSEEACRNQGMIRRLMEEIEQDFGAEAEGIYLFANDSVLDFYPKFGFRKAVEYQYSKKVSGQGEKLAKAFGEGIRKLSLCFVPWEDSGYEKEILREEDSTFFVKGDLFAEFEREQLRFPELAHA